MNTPARSGKNNRTKRVNMHEAAEFTGYHWGNEMPHGALADAKVCRHIWLWLNDAEGIPLVMEPQPFPGEPDPMPERKSTDEALVEKYQTDEEREEHRIERAVRREEETDNLV